MSKCKTLWNLLLTMASLSAGLLVIPPEAKAEMIASRMLSGKGLALVRRQLHSEIMQKEIQRFGLSESEAGQIQAVLSDERVLRELAHIESKAAATSKTTIEQTVTTRLLTALQSSVKEHMGPDLRQKLSERAKNIPARERLIASRLSTSSGAVDARKTLAQAQRMLTAEMLVALGMAKKDASRTIAKLKDSDINRIFAGGIRIGYPAGVDFSSGDGLLLLVILILAVTAAIVGGPAAVVILIVVLIALIYFLSRAHW